MGIMMAGCSKDNDIIDTPQQPEKKDHVVTLTTTISMDGGAQTRALNAEGVKTFAVGETMAVVYENKSGTKVKAESNALESTDLINDGQSAKITVALTNPKDGGTVKYIYPAAMAGTNDVDYTKLNSQDGTLTTISSKYDLATFEGTLTSGNLPSATLENQLAILEIKLNNSKGTSEITSDITGMTVSDGTNSYTVSRSAAAGPIYVAIRPTSSASIALTANDGTSYYTKSLTDKTYEVNNIYPVNWKMEKAYPFTVAEGKKVAFAPGNLQATYNGSTWNWHFAANQWDCIGDATGNTKVTDSSPFISENATVDLFGWVGASSTWDGVNMYGITSSTVTSAQNGYGDAASEDLKADWGNNIGTGWRTLTKNEWTYLFNTREVNGGKGSGKSYTLGQSVNGKSGIVIYPDNYDGGVYSGSDWSTFEAAGCVFLPAAGSRLGADVTMDNGGSFGRYWSATSSSTDGSAYHVHFTSSELFPSADFSRATGCSVRLVRDL